MTSDTHVKYDKTLKSQSIQQQYIGIIISISMTSDKHVDSHTSKLRNLYIKRG